MRADIDSMAHRSQQALSQQPKTQPLGMSAAALLLLVPGAAAQQIDPAHAAKIEIYHVNPSSYRAPISPAPPCAAAPR